jgi:hypothetical protein
MNIVADDPLGALLVLFLLIVVLWLVAYTASRVALASGVPAVDQAFAAVADADGDTVRIAVHLVGTRPAHDVAVGWASDVPGAPFSSTVLLTPVRPLIAVVPAASVPTDLDPGGVAQLDVRWRTAGEQGTGSRFAVVPVVLPRRPG